MEAWMKHLIEKERKKRKEPLEVKKIGRNCYLYTSTTVWSKKEKRRRKVSRYIGKITEKGVVEGTRTMAVARSIYEYGDAKLLRDVADGILDPLKQAFPREWQEIFVLGVVRLLHQSPLKLIKSRWEKLYLCREIDASLSPNTLSEKLRKIGVDWDAQKEFFSHLMSQSSSVVFDLSSIFSYSENLRLAEKGHNADHLFLKQVNFALFFSSDLNLPVMMKPLPGSVRDIKSFKHLLLEEWPLNSVLVVLDRGLASYTLPEILKEREMRFILPLRRNFQIIDYTLEMNHCFIYRDRGINWTKKKIDDDHVLYLFEDVRLRAEEETTYIELIKKKKRKPEALPQKRKQFGKIAILSNVDEDGERIYLSYKMREEIEIAFDAMKNEMENDKTYLSNDDAVRGYFFVSFLSLYLYFRVLDMLRRKDLIGKMSVNEVLFELSKVYLVYYSDGRKRLSEIPAKVEKLEKILALNLFPKELRS